MIVEQSDFQDNRLIGQYGEQRSLSLSRHWLRLIIVSLRNLAIVTESNTKTCSLYIESNTENVVSFPCSDVKPMPPYDQGERCLGTLF